MKMLEVGLYENLHVTFTQKYKKTSRQRATCVREGVQKVENRSILGDLNMNGVDRAEKCSEGPESKVHEGMATHNNGEAVLISQFTVLLRHMMQEMLHYKAELPKRLLEE